MPDSTVFVTGTGTEVGKTWLTARLSIHFRMKGYQVAARKPVMSFDESDQTTDAQVLSMASGEPEELVCPSNRRYELPMAPPMAAEALGRPPFDVLDLVDELNLPDKGLALIEGVGGLRSPLAFDGDSIAFIKASGPDEIILVSECRLGVINEVLTSCDALGRRPLVFLNHFSSSDDLHVRNLDWLREKSQLTVFTSPTELAIQLMPTPPNNLGPRSRSVEVQ